jgi:hypothetical protein
MVSKEKFFVQRSTPEALRKLERYEEAESLYGTDVHVEDDGTVLYPRWRTVEPGTVHPGTFSSLSGRKMPDSSLMRQGLVSKRIRERTIAEVIKDGGSVEAAIRSVGYVMRQEEEIEKLQAEAILERAKYLIDYFEQHRLSSILPHERERLEGETMAMLLDVGLDPDRIRLDVKRLSLMWIIQSSGGKDSLDRDNELIALQAAYAAERAAKERAEAIDGPILLTYSQWEGALTLARGDGRQVLQETGYETENRLLGNIYILGRERRVAGDYQWLINKVRALSLNLEKPKVKPYKTVALKGKKHLDRLKDLLVAGKEDASRRQEIRESGLLQEILQVMSLDPEIGDFGRTLLKNAYVYPENSA